MTRFHDPRIPARRVISMEELLYQAFERRLDIEHTDRRAYIVINGATWAADREQVAA